MNRKYDDFVKDIDPKVQSLMDSLREFCFSLGSNVIEDVRMHRVVFCKSFAFRWFADVEPQNNSVLLIIQKMSILLFFVVESLQNRFHVKGYTTIPTQ